MKKIFAALILMCLLFTFSGVAAAEDAADIYVRKDVYQSDMKNINEKLDSILSELRIQREDINKLTQSVIVLSERIDNVNKSLNDKIDAVDKRLGEKIDGVDKKLSARMDDLRNGLYLVLTLIVAIISLPFVRNWYEERAKQKTEARNPLFTLDDVKRLIEENNAMLLSKLQGG